LNFPDGVLISFSFPKVLLEEPFRKRRTLLREAFVPYASQTVEVASFDFVESIGSEEGQEAVELFWQRAVESRSEGLMVKVSLDSAFIFIQCLPPPEAEWSGAAHLNSPRDPDS
jgi:hypothetical protein